jgi:hypothetical protein
MKVTRFKLLFPQSIFSIFEFIEISLFAESDPEYSIIASSYEFSTLQSPYTETIDLCIERFFVKEIMRVIELLQEIKRADK